MNKLTTYCLIILAAIAASCKPNIDHVMDEAREKMDANQYQEAVSIISETIDKGVHRYDMYNLRGSAYLELDKRSEALADFNMAIEAGAKDYRPLYNRGNLYRRMDKPEEAIRDYSNALLLNKNEPYIFLNRALCFWRLGELKNAVADLDRANFITKGRDRDILFYRGKLMIEGGFYFEALAELKKLVGMEPNFGEAYFLMIMAETRIDGMPREELCEDIKKAIELGHTKVERMFGGYCL